MFTIRKATESDTPAITAIYDTARSFMRANGNMKQWVGGYPSVANISADIAAGNLYLITVSDMIVGVFCLIIGEDPTYCIIEGRWLNDRPYGTIHRIASSGKYRGIADAALDYSLTLTGDIRIDTHEDNIPMQRWCKKKGFAYCGIIHLADGSPRLVYQLTNNNADRV